MTKQYFQENTLPVLVLVLCALAGLLLTFFAKKSMSQDLRPTSQVQQP